MCYTNPRTHSPQFDVESPVVVGVVSAEDVYLACRRDRERSSNISARVVAHGKGCPYSSTERRVPELIPVLGSQPAGDVSHKPDGGLPLLSARPAVTPRNR